MNRVKKAISLMMALALVVSATLIGASAKEPILRTAKGWVQIAFTENGFDIKNGNAVMDATTQGSLDTTNATVDLYLEKLVNGKWVEVRHWSDSNDDCYIDVYYIYALDKGYNYHIRTVHTATGPRGTDTDEITSPSLWY